MKNKTMLPEAFCRGPSKRAARWTSAWERSNQAIPCPLGWIIATAIVLFAVPTEDVRGESVSLTDYQTAAMTRSGDAAAGEKIFFEMESSKCGTCHRVGKRGGNVGPELSKIGGKFDRIHLIESILHPATQIVEGYQSSQILTTDGTVLVGVVKEESDDGFVLLTADGKRLPVNRADVETVRPIATSIMPDGLHEGMTVEQFVDLIAYLESQQSGADGKFGSTTSGPLRTAEGLRLTPVATGLHAAVALETLPDGRVLVCQQSGELIVFERDVRVPKPMLTLDVEHNWERGLIGVTVDPDFASEPWVYVCYVTDKPYSHHVISRFRVDRNVADPQTEQRLIEGDDQEKFGGFKKSGHQGGALHFGTDGMLYVALGEQTAKRPAQDLGALQGKILRLNRDGSIPNDNPLVDRTEGKYRSIWATGLRNPFTFAVHASGTLLINDVGGKHEEINRGVPGANYGWPVVDHGPSDNGEFLNPVHFYPEASISGGDFAPDTAPPSLRGRYVFGDFVHGWIRSIDATKAVSADQGSGSLPAQDVASGLRRIVDLRFASDGSLYVLLRNAWISDDKLAKNSGSLWKLEADHSQAANNPSERPTGSIRFAGR